MSITQENFVPTFGLGQVFNVLGQYIPNKASIFLRRYGNDPINEFTLKNDGSIMIDATNFINYKQSDNNISFNNSLVSDFVGPGFMSIKRPVQILSKLGQLYVSSLAQGGGIGTFSDPLTIQEGFAILTIGIRIVIIDDGLYNISNFLFINASGTSNNIIEIFGANSNGVIDGTRPQIINSGSMSSMISFADRSKFITLKNLYIDCVDNNTIGISSQGPSGNDYIIDNVYITRSSSAISFISITDQLSGNIAVKDCNLSSVTLSCVITDGMPSFSGPSNFSIIDSVMTSSNGVSLTIMANEAVVNNCIFYNSFAGIDFKQSGTKVSVNHCTYYNITNNANRAFSISSAQLLFNNSCFFKIQGKIFSQGSFTWVPDFSYCLADEVGGYIEDGPDDLLTWLSFTGNIADDPDFMSLVFGNDNYLKPTSISPLVKSAGDGTDIGANQSLLIDTTNFSSIDFPINVDISGTFYIYVRMRSFSNFQDIGYQLIIDNVVLDSIKENHSKGTWNWLRTKAIFSNKGKHTLTILIHLSSNVAIDEIYISSTILTSNDLIALHTDKIVTNNYVTVHAKVFEVDDLTFLPQKELDIYDAINNIDTIIIDDWYNLSLLPLSGHITIDFPNKYVLIIYTSGDTDKSYIVWDFGNFIEDPYLPIPSISSKSIPNEWKIDFINKQALNIWSFMDSLDPTGCKIISPSAKNSILSISKFDDPNFSPKFLNTKIVSTGSISNKIQLDLPKRIISLVIDNSGSMSWNDQEGIRFDMARRLVNRISSTYPGDVKYNLFSFGGSFIKSDFIGVVEEDTQDFSRIANVQNAVFADPDNNFAGVRVVRKTGSYPINPIDGDIILDGFTDLSFTEDLDENERYFFKIFTFDKDRNFSHGKKICATPRIRQIPQGISAFRQQTLFGTTTIKEDTNLVLYHFDDAHFRLVIFINETASREIIDWSDNRLRLEFVGSSSPIWLLGGSSPAGFGAMSFSGKQNDTWKTKNKYLWNELDSLTILLWARVSVPSVGSSSTLFSIMNEGDIQVQMQLSVDDFGNITFISDDGGTSVTWSSSILFGKFEFNSWHHITITFDRNTNPQAILFIDGIKMSNGTINSSVSSSNNIIEKHLWLGSVANVSGTHLKGAIAEFSIFKEVKSSSYIINSYQLSLEDRKLDNGDRLVLLTYDIPDDFDFVGGKVRINMKAALGTRETEIIEGRVKTLEEVEGGKTIEQVFGGGLGNGSSDSTKLSSTVTNIIPETTPLLQEIVFYGEAPTWEEDGEVVFDETVSNSGEFSVAVSKEYIHGVKYYFRIFSQNIIGNYSFLTDSPFLEIDIPKVDKFEEVISIPDPKLPSVILSSNSIVPGNKKIFVKWTVPIDVRLKQVKVYYLGNKKPTINENDIDESDGVLIFQGDLSKNEFVHRGLPNDLEANYAILLGDKFGFSSKAVFVSAIPSVGLDESLIPLKEVKALLYKVVDESSLTIEWQNPIKIDNDIQAWFEQRIILFGRITDEFGRPIIDTSKVSINVAGTIRSSRLSDDVFGQTIRRNIVTPKFEEVILLSQQEISNGVVKGVLRLTPSLEALSEFQSISITTSLTFTVKDPKNPKVNSFKYTKQGPSILFKNPWKMGIINQGLDFVNIKCLPSEGGSWLDNLIDSISGKRKSITRKFNGTFCRRKSPLKIRAYATYRDNPIPSGSGVSVAVFDADDPKCDDDFKPNFFDRKSTDISLLSSFFEFKTGKFVTPESGTLPVVVSFVDIPLSSPRVPKGVMLFVKASFNGFVSRKSIYLVYDNILKINLNARVPEPNCSSISNLSAYAYLIDPDDPNKLSPVTDFSIVKFESASNVPDKEVPFFSTDNVDTVSGVVSFTRNGRAQDIFFGPLCDVKQLGIFSGEFGPEPIFETYFFRVSITFDGLTAFDAKRFEVQPQGGSKLQQFSDHFLMETRQITEIIWADGFDRAEIVIQHNPSISQSSLSNCFRHCSQKDGAFLFSLGKGQIVDIQSNSIENVYPLSLTWGDDVSVLFDPYLDEEVISGGKTSIDFAKIDLSRIHDFTKIYVTSNSEVQDPQRRIIPGSSYTDLLRGISNDASICSCMPGGDGVGREQYSNDFFFSGQTFLYFENSTFFLSGGGNWGFGFPPCRVRLKEPLGIRLVYIKDINTDSVVQNVTIDGKTSHELVYEVTFSGKNVPDNVPVFVDIGGDNASDVSIESNVAFVKNIIDDNVDPDNVRSLVSIIILPIIPIHDIFRFQLQVSVTYDKKNEVDRIKKLCIELRYDQRPKPEPPPLPKPVIPETKISPKKEEDLFERRGSVFDPNIGEWAELGNKFSSNNSMHFSRGALTLTNAFDTYGEKLYAIGGVNNSQILNVNEEYNIPSGTWSIASSMNTPRFFHMSCNANGFIYVIGGFTFNSKNEKLRTTVSVERYDPFIDAWENVKNMPVGIAMGVVIHKNNHIYILCGITDLEDNKNTQKDFASLSDSIYVYDIDNDVWDIIGPFIGADLELYQRIYPFIFENDDHIYVMSGARQIKILDIDDNEIITLFFLTETFSFDVVQGIIENSDFKFDTLPIPRFRGGSVSFADKHYLVGGESLLSQAGDTSETINTSTDSFSYNTIDKLTKGLSSFGMSTDSLGKVYVVGGLTSGRPPGFLQVRATADRSVAELNDEQNVVITIKLRDSTGTIPNNVKVVVRGFLIFPCFKESIFDVKDKNRSGSSDLSQQSGSDNINRFALIYPVNFTRNEFFITNGIGTTTLLPRSEDVLARVDDIRTKLGISDSELFGASGCFKPPKTLIMFDGRQDFPYKIRVQITIVDDFFFGQSLLILDDILNESEDTTFILDLPGPGKEFPNEPKDVNCVEVDGKIICDDKVDTPTTSQVDTPTTSQVDTPTTSSTITPKKVRILSNDCINISTSVIFSSPKDVFSSNAKTEKLDVPVSPTTNETTGVADPLINLGDISGHPSAPSGVGDTTFNISVSPTNSKSTGISIDNLISLFSNASSFTIIPSEIPQSESPTIQYKSAKKPWVPIVVQHIDSNIGTSVDTLKSLQRLQFSNEVGASPLYDALLKASDVMQSSSGDGSKKSIYVFTDNEESISSLNVEETIAEIQSIDGFKETPVIMNNLSIVFPVALSSLLSRTDTESLDRIAVETSGQSTTILSKDFIDEVLNNSLGRVIGSVGYGNFKYIIDLNEKTIINKVGMDANIFSNTDGNWKVAVSDDRFNFSNFSDQFDVREEVSFKDLSGRFIMFDITLLSGFSASIEEVYESIATSGVPSVEQIDIGFSIPRKSYIFLEPEKSISRVQQIAISINANNPFLSSINIGSLSGNTFNFDDYFSSSKPLISRYGKTLLPLRTPRTNKEISESFSNLEIEQEKLLYIDGFSWKVPLGRWSPNSDVNIIDTNNIALDKTEYIAFPREGIIVFPNKKNIGDIFFIKIDNILETRIAIEIVNRFGLDSVEIDGIGYMFNTNTFLPPSVNESLPVAKNLVINPKIPFIYSKIIASYDFFDINRDPENIDKTIIRWFINNSPIKFLENVREFNDINNFEDPVWKKNLFSFLPEEIPDGISVELFARQQSKALERQEGLFKVGDSLFFEVTPHDGKNHGKPIRSSSIIITEAPPFAVNVEIIGKHADGTFTRDVTTSIFAIAMFEFFIDSEENKSQIVWIVNDQEFKKGSVFGNTNGFPNNQISPKETNSDGILALQTGNSILVKIIPSTNISEGKIIKSLPIEVLNTPPEVINIAISPVSPNSQSNLSVSYLFIDLDVSSGDITQEDKSIIQWFRKRSDEDKFIEETEATEKVVDSSFISNGDLWKARITPFDGISSGVPKESEVIRIES